MVLILHSNKQKLLRGESYWKILLDSGKEVVEGQHSFDLLRGVRSVDWYLELSATTDCAHIRELTICTPQGDVTLHVTEKYSAFQFKQGMMPMFSGGRALHAHVIGRVDDKETGECTCVIWDALDRKLHVGHVTNIHHFKSWRAGTPDLGAINYAAMGVRL